MVRTGLGRRSALLPVALMLALAGCAPAAPAPSPTAAPAKPAAQPTTAAAKPAATTAPAQPAAAAQQPAAKPAAAGDKFGELVKAAEAEMGKTNGLMRMEFDFDEQTVKPLLDGFTKEFPFVKQVKFASLQNVENYQVVFLELQAGRAPRMDAIGVSNELLTDWAKAGAVQKPVVPFKEINASLPSDWGKLDDRGIDPEGYFVNINANVRGITYNHELIPADKAPKNWDDCLRPEFKGKVGLETRIKVLPFMTDPTVKPWFTQQWLPAMVNQAVFTRGMSQALETMASGQILMHCGINYNTTMRNVERNKFPLTFVLPDPYPVELGVPMHTPKGSAAPATSELFALYAATKGQEHVAKSWEELSWYPNGTLAKLLSGGQKASVCPAACLAQGDTAQTEYSQILGIPGQ